MSLKLKRYILNVAEKDLKPGEVSATNEDVVELDNQNIYKIISLPFGGFIAIDPENIHCYKRRIKSKLVTKRLRKPMKFTGIS